MSLSTCPYCHDLVHTSSGYFVQHGQFLHGHYALCIGSASPVCSFSSIDCCS